MDINKLYIIIIILAIQHKKRDKVIEFFDLYGPDLHGKPEWSQWFGQLYIHIYSYLY